MKEKMTLRELIASGIFDSETKFFLVTTGDDIPLDPDDYFVMYAFGDYAIYKVEASDKGAIRVFFDIQPMVRKGNT